LLAEVFELLIRHQVGVQVLSKIAEVVALVIITIEQVLLIVTPAPAVLR
jgi:hypothetical protein